MKNFLLNPFFLTVFIMVTGSLVTSAALGAYTKNLHINYDAQLNSIEQAIEDTVAETAEIKAVNEEYAKILEIKNMIAKMAGTKFTDEELLHFSTSVANAANDYNIEPALIAAIIATESSFRNNAVSHKGAIGLMQLLPSTAFYISDKTKYSGFNNESQLFDTETNIRLGVSYLAYLIEKTGSVEHAVIAYNYGPVNLKRALNNNKALPQNYVRTVMKNYNKAKTYLS